MSLFSDRVDRFFIGKLIVGLLFIVSVLQALRATIALTGQAASTVGTPGQSAVFYAAVSIVWLLIFRFIESRRARTAAKRATRT